MNAHQRRKYLRQWMRLHGIERQPMTPVTAAIRPMLFFDGKPVGTVTAIDFGDGRPSIQAYRDRWNKNVFGPLARYFNG